MLEHVQCLHRMQIPPQCVANLFQGRNWQICIQWVSALFSFLNDVGDLDIFGPIGRVITPAKCGGKTVRGIELLTSNNDLPLTILKLPQNQHRPGFFLGWFRHFSAHRPCHTSCKMWRQNSERHWVDVYVLYQSYSFGQLFERNNSRVWGKLHQPF